MKLGVKTWDSESFLKHLENQADFFEIQAIQKNNYDFLEKFSKPIIFHVEHNAFGVNIADKSIHKINLDSINYAKKLADRFKARKIILHPGNLTNKNCSKEQAISFIKSLNDKRIIIENLTPFYKGLCKTPEEMKEFLELTGVEFCFDINHAVQNALNLKIDYMEFLKEFIKLKPAHYHIGGQKLKKEDESHESFKDSELNLKEILKLLPKDAEITLEVTIDIQDTENDLKIVRNVIKEINY